MHVLLGAPLRAPLQLTLSLSPALNTIVPCPSVHPSVPKAIKFTEVGEVLLEVWRRDLTPSNLEVTEDNTNNREKEESRAWNDTTTTPKLPDNCHSA